MKNRPHYLRLLLCFTALFVTIIDSKTAITSASSGIEMCLRTIIPSLFPAMILCDMLVQNLSTLNLHMISTFETMCNLPTGSGGIFISGLLGGYPIGAKLIAQHYNSGNISKNKAQILLKYCSNAGPAFIFGLCGPLFPNLGYPLALWLIHITASLFVAKNTGRGSSEPKLPAKKQPYSITQSIQNCTLTMAFICSWIIIFRVMIGFIVKWFLWRLPEATHAFIIGSLELSNGIYLLKSTSEIGLKFILCSFMLACGGTCILLQTKQVIGALSIKPYLAGKATQTAISIALSIIFVSLLKKSIPLNAVLLILISLLLLVISLDNVKKYVAFSFKMIYNKTNTSAR